MPEIYIVSNVKVNGEAIGSLGDGEAVWHTDMSYLEKPPKASMLYSLEIPDVGGNTSFCSMYAIYEALPAALKARIAGLKIKHDGTYNSGGYLRQGVTATDDPRTSPGALHPLVCKHPDSGRRMLYLGRRRNAYIDGLALAESEALLDELWSYVKRPGIRLGACVAGRRSRAVGQPLHHASPRRVRSRPAPHHAPHPNQGRSRAGGVSRLMRAGAAGRRHRAAVAKLCRTA